MFWIIAFIHTVLQFDHRDDINNSSLKRKWIQLAFKMLLSFQLVGVVENIFGFSSLAEKVGIWLLKKIRHHCVRVSICMGKRTEIKMINQLEEMYRIKKKSVPNICISYIKQSVYTTQCTAGHKVHEHQTECQNKPRIQL